MADKYAGLCVGGPMDGQWITSLLPRFKCWGLAPVVHPQHFRPEPDYNEYQLRTYVDIDGKEVTLWVMDATESPLKMLIEGYQRPKSASL